MSGLPEIPDLDPKGKAKPTSSAGSQPDLASQLTHDTQISKTSARRPIEEEVPIDVEADQDGTAGMRQTQISVKGAVVGDETQVRVRPDVVSESVEVVSESVEEVLNQQTGQTVKLVRLEEVISELADTVNDMREEMHAGFIESNRSTPSAGGSVDGALLSRVEELELQAGRIERAHKRSFLLAVAQALILILLFGMMVMLRPEPAKAPRTPVVSKAPAPAMVDQDSEPQPPSSPARKNKRRRRR